MILAHRSMYMHTPMKKLDSAGKVVVRESFAKGVVTSVRVSECTCKDTEVKKSLTYWERVGYNSRPGVKDVVLREF
jgi:hypothetical protein